MKRLQAKPTPAKNLEDKFDRGEEVLDYFEVTKARLINPRSKGSAVKTKFASARIDIIISNHATAMPKHRVLRHWRARLASPRFQSQRRTSRFNSR